MHKKNNPFAIVAIVISVIVGFVAASAIKGNIPSEYHNWSGFVFWLVFVAITGIGTFLSGRYVNRRK